MVEASERRPLQKEMIAQLPSYHSHLTLRQAPSPQNVADGKPQSPTLLMRLTQNANTQIEIEPRHSEPLTCMVKIVAREPKLLQFLHQRLQ